ncbi:MAG: UDP-N-acetylmuramoyl-tripeptide--D-alanyl-D-alanine ligase [Candidatus Saccharimonadales bacterium]
MQNLAKELVTAILASQVKRLRQRRQFKVVAIAGSIGKTSTKLAVVKVLEQKYRVRSQEGNYNHLITVPLVFFGQKLPSLRNPLAWLRVFWNNERLIGEEYPYDIVVVELGTDGPGQLAEFHAYLKADIGVLTAITHEHMKFFTDLDDVAKEELELTKLSEKVIVNKDLTSGKYLKDIKNPLITYGLKQPANVQLDNLKFDNFASDFVVRATDKPTVEATYELITEPLLYGVTAAVAVGHQFDMTAEQIERGIGKIKPVNGRMQLLRGVNGSSIIDDTYNASPEATKAALSTLYRLKADHKIAILGNMNELGTYSEAAHRGIGQYCDPKQLDLVVTLGPDANKYLAEEAESKGCTVSRFDDPYTLGDYLKVVIAKDTIILAKGSQNRVFAEEAVKTILKNSADSTKLVRQSPEWLKIKKKAFSPQ